MIDSYMLPYRLVFWQGDIFYYMIIANEWYKEYWYKKKADRIRDIEPDAEEANAKDEKYLSR